MLAFTKKKSLKFMATAVKHIKLEENAVLITFKIDVRFT